MTLKARWQQHCCPSSECVYLGRAIQKYGRENFTVEQIDIAADRDELDKKEIYWIDFYNSTNHSIGYNIHTGGEHHVTSEETKKKISESMKGRIFSEEHRRKISEAKKGVKKSPEEVERMRQRMRGKYQGENNYWWGKNRSDETKRKISIARKGKYALGDSPNALKVENIETGEIFDCMKLACEKYKMNASSLTKVCRGKRPTCGGYHWRYFDGK